MGMLIARVWPLVLFAAAVALMVHDGRGDPFDPALAGTARYGHNHEGALQQMVTFAAVELVVLYLVLWPGSDRVWRAGVALLLFAGWTAIMLMMLMHAGGIVAVHWMWLVAVDIGLLVVMIARILRRR